MQELVLQLIIVIIAGSTLTGIVDTKLGIKYNDKLGRFTGITHKVTTLVYGGAIGICVYKILTL